MACCFIILCIVLQDAMMALNSELQLSQGTIGELKSSVREVHVYLCTDIRIHAFTFIHST